MRFLFTWLLICTFLFNSKAALRIEGTIVNNHTTLPVRLWKYSEGKLQQVDSAATSSVFHFSANLATTTLFAVQIENGVKQEILADPADSIIRLLGSVNDFKTGAASLSGSRTLEAYYQYLRLQTDFENKVIECVNRVNSVPLYDSAYTTLRREGQQQLAGIIAEYGEQLSALSTQHAGSFISEVVIPLSRRSHYLLQTDPHFDSDYSFQHYHFWDNVPFTEPAILNHPLFQQRLTEYMTDFVPNEQAGIEHGVGIIFAQPMCSAVREYLLKYFIRKLIEKEYSQSAAWVFNSFGAPYMQVSFSDFQQAINLTTLETGVDFPPLVLKDAQGNYLASDDVISTSEKTIIWFWSSGCDHCARFNDMISQQFKAARKKKIGLYSVCMADEADSFKKEAASSVIKWKLVSDGLGWNSPLVQKFQVFITPKVYVVDKEGKILMKDLDIESTKALINSQ